ncbi:DNA double-strand break repair nuclease NurA [Umezakia ovalisporum]|uniref:NurA domain-containing protein n=2 Tax=Umezakia ovalisporum TaxID=75695 RepID=A0AA43KE32_9CYAN|nr:DNA double-strand break repair nuclease NurA [Umezakia ovalisporum]MDH6055303.1 hypothetical protein [Umezakia ovalisporum FSS-43]MDH6062608.1 hypothetical protein [Umezakia ovalisporum FSS-62]MDH6066396.1 hypothetical protein [Umezakia ovalisporum APH033B]MDH6071238.1 hypothetical protein [Umezakia ovalisporum CobakiLakeA]MDH6073758.1 hypothetical protein [Umezakia ovalisporum CS-1034]
MLENNHVNNFWRSHNFRLEPWGNDYEPQIQINEELALSESEVNPTVETDNWDSFESQEPPLLPNRLIFTDGRLRLDAALIGGEGNTITYGVFGTIAVGAVVIDRTIPKASYLDPEIDIHRVIGFGGEQEAVSTAIPCPFGSKSKLFYKAFNDKFDNTPAARGAIVQTAMLKAEEKLVGKLDIKDAETLVIRDGSLRYESPVLTLGYVKTMHRQYLPEKYAPFLWKLLPGQRTPIFEIKLKNRYQYSWYLKSGSYQHFNKQLGYHDLHGIVRLELSIKNGIDRATEIANQTCYLIPYYASHPSKDPRAPQNLAPVGALERELGRRMGDATLIKRRLQNFLASVGGNK